MIRLLIADDHPVVRAGLAGLFADEEGFDVVGQATDGAQAVELVAREKPDVVLMDLRMPVLDGVAATASIVAMGDDAPRVLILTTYESDDQILAAIEAGAAGYLLKAAGQTALSPAVAARLVLRMREPAASVTLTPREIEVLRLVARGRSNKLIGLDLGIGESTVKTHLLKVFDKLEVADRTHAVTVALERGIL